MADAEIGNIVFGEFVQVCVRQVGAARIANQDIGVAGFQKRR